MTRVSNEGRQPEKTKRSVPFVVVFSSGESQSEQEREKKAHSPEIQAERHKFALRERKMPAICGLGEPLASLLLRRRRHAVICWRQLPVVRGLVAPQTAWERTDGHNIGVGFEGRRIMKRKHQPLICAPSALDSFSGVSNSSPFSSPFSRSNSISADLEKKGRIRSGLSREKPSHI